MKKVNKPNKFRLLLVLTIPFLIFLTIAVAKSDKSQNPPAPTISEPTSKNLETIRKITIDINDKCKTEPATCYEEAARRQLLDKYETREILAAIYDFDKYYSCHAFTHFLGRALYKKIGSIPDAYSQVDFTCHGGTYHGVLEAFLDERKTTIDEISGKELAQICADSPKKAKKSQDQIITECFHGYGHAFMFITESDLPKSLAYCDKLDPIYQERCWGGTFMENSTSSTNIDHPTQWLKADDKFYPCTILESRYLAQCYFYQANYLLKETNRDWNRVFLDCQELKDTTPHDYCILGMGAQLASVSNEQGISVAASVCQKAPNQDDAYICIEGAVPSLFARYGGDTPQIHEFCQKVTLFLREFCFAKLGSVAKTYWQYDRPKLQEICNKTRQYQNACLEGTERDFKY
ncbi:MAG: hypothetical protein AAB639_01130 [Patescibacteria group bacterium]